MAWVMFCLYSFKPLKPSRPVMICRDTLSMSCSALASFCRSVKWFTAVLCSSVRLGDLASSLACSSEIASGSCISRTMALSTAAVRSGVSSSLLAAATISSITSGSSRRFSTSVSLAVPMDFLCALAARSFGTSSLMTSLIPVSSSSVACALASFRVSAAATRTPSSASWAVMRASIFFAVAWVSSSDNSPVLIR